MTKKIIGSIFLSLFATIVLFFLFQKPIFSSIANLYCNHLCQLYLNGTFAYDAVEYEAGYLTFHKIQVLDRNTQKTRLTAESLKIKYDLAFDHLDLDILLFAPKLDLLGQKHALTKLPRFPPPFFRIFGHLNISDAVLAYAGHEDVFFGFEGEYRPDVPEHLKLEIGFRREDPQIEIIGSSDKRKKHLDCHFKQADCPKLSRLVNQMVPQLDILEFKHGTIDGTLNFLLAKGKNASFESNLAVKEVKLKMEEYEGDISLLTLTLDHSDDRQEVSDFKHLFLKSLANSQGVLKISQSHVNKNQRKMFSLRGDLHFPSQEANLDGVCSCQEREFSWQLQGRVGMRCSLQGKIGEILTNVETIPLQQSFKMDLRGNIRDLANLLSFNFPKQVELSDFQLSLGLNSVFTAPQIEGVLCLKDQADPVHFGFDARYCSVWKWALGEGWLKTKKFAPTAFLSSLSPNVVFEDLSAKVCLGESFIRLKQLECHSRDVFLGGTLDIAFEDRNVLANEVFVQADIINGKLSQFLEFLKPFSPPDWISAYPIEGEISARQNGAAVRLSFDSNAKVVADVKMQGMISNANINPGWGFCSLQDCKMYFDYNNLTKTFLLTEIEGQLLTGSQEPYTVNGDIHFKDYSKSNCMFDLWVSDTNRDVFRVVGHSKLDGMKHVQFAFDPQLTHFGGVRPKNCDLSLNLTGNVEKLDLACAFSPQSFLSDLQKMIPAYLPIQFLKYVNKVEGKSDFNLHYNALTRTFEYELKSRNLTFDDQSFETFFLIGKKIGNSWSIDQLQLDQYSLAADMTYRDDYLDLNFLGISIKETLLAGLEGVFQKEGIFKGKINLLEADIEQFLSWKPFQKIAKNFQPKGKLNGLGEFSIQLTGKHCDYEGLLFVKLEDFHLKGIPLPDIESVTCHLDSRKGIILNHIKGASRLTIEQIDFDFSNRHLTVNNLLFNLPFKKFKHSLKNAARIFPETFSSHTRHILGIIQKNKNIKGSLNLTCNEEGRTTFQLDLDPDVYGFNGIEVDLKSFRFRSNPYEWKLSTHAINQEDSYWLFARSSGPLFNCGEIDIFSRNPEETDDHIQVLWKQTLEEGFQIKQANGMISGVLVNIEPLDVENNSGNLAGSVSFQLDKIPFFLKSKFGEKLRTYGLKGNFTLKGNWAFGEKTGFFFNGTLQGQELIFKDCLFRSCTANIEFSPQIKILKNIFVTDSCGRIEVPEMGIELVKDDARFRIPLLRINQLRPNLLRNSRGFLAASATPLLFKQIEVKNLEGSLLDPDHIVGEGRLAFANPKKSTSFEKKLSAVGLDPTLLTPVSGSIYYTIRDGKILLTKFKDLYSAGKLSKFSLQKTPHQSFMDFDGNLHVYVKMKQYNLLFKLADLFTMTIQGTFQNPEYALQTAN